MVRLARRDHDVRIAVSLVVAVAFVSIVTGIDVMVTASIPGEPSRHDVGSKRS